MDPETEARCREAFETTQAKVPFSVATLSPWEVFQLGFINGHIDGAKKTMAIIRAKLGAAS